MDVQLLQYMSGMWNSTEHQYQQPWPAVGELMSVTDAEAADLVASGHVAQLMTFGSGTYGGGVYR
jgi:hypothetical protein